MPKITKDSIDKALVELGAAFLESMEADQAEEDIKLKKIRAHKRLTLARDAIRDIRFN